MFFTNSIILVLLSARDDDDVRDDDDASEEDPGEDENLDDGEMDLGDLLINSMYYLYIRNFRNILHAVYRGYNGI